MQAQSDSSDLFSNYARFYDLDFGEMDSDLFLIQQLAARCGSPILELACGTGRVLLPLARQGYRVTGVDISPSMLQRAREKVTAAGLADRVTLVQQDMRRLAVSGGFALALVVFNSFMHLTSLEEQLACLEGIRRHLNPGGLLLLDLFNPDLSRLLDFCGQVRLEKVMLDPETGQRVMKYSTERVDLAAQTIHATHIIDLVSGDGQIERILFPFDLRYVFRSELELLLLHAGFEIEAFYGSYDLDVFDSESEKLIAVARRTA